MMAIACMIKCLLVSPMFIPMNIAILTYSHRATNGLPLTLLMPLGFFRQFMEQYFERTHQM